MEDIEGIQIVFHNRFANKKLLHYALDAKDYAPITWDEIKSAVKQALELGKKI